MQAVPLLPAGSPTNSFSKPSSLLNKFPRGLLLPREDSLTCTPRPIRSAANEQEYPTGLSSPVTSEASEASSSADVNAAFWTHANLSQQNFAHLPPSGKPPVTPSASPASKATTLTSPFAVSQATNATAAGGQAHGPLVSLLDAAINTSQASRSKDALLRRSLSAPMMEPVPENYTTEQISARSFAMRPTLSADGPDNYNKLSAMSRSPQPSAPKVRRGRSSSIVRGVMVTPSPAELNRLFQDSDEVVMCEIRIVPKPALPAIKTSSGPLYEIMTGWHVPAEEFPFSPRADAVVKALDETAPFQQSLGWCGLMSKLYTVPKFLRRRGGWVLH